MFCSSCGKTLEEGKSFCTLCGASVSSHPVPNVANTNVQSRRVSPIGIIMTVIGAIGVFWSFSRINSLAGQFYTWSPPFSEFEMQVISVLVVSALLGIGGLIALVIKKK